MDREATEISFGVVVGRSVFCVELRRGLEAMGPRPLSELALDLAAGTLQGHPGVRPWHFARLPEGCD